MVFLDLFFTFFLIGTVSFGGGYGMIPLIRSLVVERGWLTFEGVSNIIAISETTPGPIAVNMATYIGSTVGGFLGSLLATMGVVLPAFIIMLIIVKVLKRFKENIYVQAFLNGVKPIVIALVMSVGVLMMVRCFYVNFGDFSYAPTFDFVSLGLMAGLVLIKIVYAKVLKKNLSPIILIIFSAAMGILIF